MSGAGSHRRVATWTPQRVNVVSGSRNAAGGGAAGSGRVTPKRNAAAAATATSPNIVRPTGVAGGVGAGGSSVAMRSTVSASASSMDRRTVARMRPAKALKLPEATTVTEAALRMATQRVDAVLLTSDSNARGFGEGPLKGILTDRDVVSRVVAKGLNPDTVKVSDVMTPSPRCVDPQTNAIDALRTMVDNKFRHLPVVKGGQVMGLLDITKCLYDAIAKMERINSSSATFCDAMGALEREWAENHDVAVPHGLFEQMREKMLRPDLGMLLEGKGQPPEVTSKSTVRDAARAMVAGKTTAVLVVEDGRACGIFTSKDVLLRVVAAGRNPDSTTVIRVMTPHPDCVTPDTTILDALHTMHDNRYLHLPVVAEDGAIFGLVDVLQLTYGVMNQVESGSSPTGTMPSADSMFSRFFSSMLFVEDDQSQRDDDSVSLASSMDGRDERLMAPSVASSVAGSHVATLERSPGMFVFKFKDPMHSTVHRFTNSGKSLSGLRKVVATRLGIEDVATMPQLCYVDEDGDEIVLGSDEDLTEAVEMARTTLLKYLQLRLVAVHDPAALVLDSEVEADPEVAKQLANMHAQLSALRAENQRLSGRLSSNKSSKPKKEKLLTAAVAALSAFSLLSVVALARK